MKRYTVLLPITGVICVEVEAETEKDAIDAALSSDDLTTDKIEEWEAHRQIVKGNVFYGSQNEAEVVGEEDIEP